MDACRRDNNEDKSGFLEKLNAARFVLLNKFISSLKPINNEMFLGLVVTPLSDALKAHVVAMKSTETKCQYVKLFVKILS